MKALSRAISAETLKMKRTLALWLTLLTPAALVFLEVAGATQNQGRLSALPPDINRWSLLFEELFSIWVLLIFPLFITLGVILLSSIGVFLGRFNRWNSWDLFDEPQSITNDMWQWLIHPIDHLRVYGFILLFTLLFLFVYVAIHAFGRVIEEARPRKKE